MKESPFPIAPTAALQPGVPGEWRLGAAVTYEGDTFVEVSEYQEGFGWKLIGWTRNHLNATRIVVAMNSHADLLACCRAAFEAAKSGRVSSPEQVKQLRAAISKAEAGAVECKAAETSQANRDRARKSAIRHWERKAKESGES